MTPVEPAPSMALELLDWRRSVAALYRAVRNGVDRDPERTLERFRAAKDDLFRTHPQSPIPPGSRAGFAGLRYWGYRPDLRFEVEVEAIGGADAGPGEPPRPGLVLARSLGGEAFPLERVGRLRTPPGDLTAYWLAVYGGGIFVAFRDATSGSSTYGGGRYLLDTIKGADLGGHGSRLVLDFNYAYHPSCAYDPRWSCPLPPERDRLPVAIEAGERLDAGG